MSIRKRAIPGIREKDRIVWLHIREKHG